ncbi:nuclear transport factor 2 family protein [Catellatospora methionotrophica]|uniref:nuclear transport factor 2 family protein n=1 Tax=Catellatospora methionotrophica TaxID=121620 RepID=UPI00140D0A8F|nr:nuclear transport factor 2 family protein [Catellatospora methionotrophica]
MLIQDQAVASAPWTGLTAAHQVGIAPRRRSAALAVQNTRVIVQEYLTRLAEGDAERIAELFAEEVECYVAAAEAAPWLASRGLAADFLRLTMPRFELGRSTVEADKVLVDGADAVVLGHFVHVIEPTGRHLSTPVAIHLSVAAGRIHTMHLYEDNVALVSRIRGKRPITASACGTVKNALNAAHAP